MIQKKKNKEESDDFLYNYFDAMINRHLKHKDDICFDNNKKLFFEDLKLTEIDFSIIDDTNKFNRLPLFENCDDIHNHIPKLILLYTVLNP